MEYHQATGTLSAHFRNMVRTIGFLVCYFLGRVLQHSNYNWFTTNCQGKVWKPTHLFILTKFCFVFFNYIIVSWAQNTEI